MKKISYTREALKTLKRIPKNTSRDIIEKINQYAESPESLANNVKQLTGYSEPTYRLRVGKWRVIFTEDGTILVIKVAPRGGAYS